MTEPLQRPKRKDPLKRTTLGHVPPRLRSRAAMEMATHAAQGRFVLQTCENCNQTTYPPRDRCPNCWGELAWREQDAGGQVAAETTIRHSTDNYFRNHMPWRIGTVFLDAGPTAIVHLHGAVGAGDRVNMTLKLDRGGNPALFAMPRGDVPNMQDDPQFRSFTADPKHRRILVTDGRTGTGQAIARALLDAGAAKVFVGDGDPLMRFAGKQELAALDGAELVPLDVTDTHSVGNLAAQLGGRVDIVINTAGQVREGGVAFGARLSDLQAGLDTGVLGLMRLAQAFGPALGARSDDGVNSAAAFLDMVPVSGLCGLSGYSGTAASAAARLSLLSGFRGEMQKGGIRVMSVLTGPVDDAWHQRLPQPKVAPSQLARTVVAALRNGQEISCAGDVAKDLFARWQANPLLTMREENR